tara:strand:+ start:39596 stop:40297 length:702 start_codon:yes stop_codon:yes gene_type:complete
MKTINYLFLILFFTIISSCSSTKILKFEKQKDDIFTTPTLKEFLDTNKNPKVVLRVNDASYTVTEGENVDYLYNAIENQLLASGFVVRDRQLFNQIIGNDDNNIDYSKLKEKSDTDLIIELTKIDPRVVYQTNKFYTKDNEERVEKYTKRERFGANVEFKVILIESNEFAGIYKFNYAPCEDGCIISKSRTQLAQEMKERKKKTKEGYEGVERDTLELFMKDATRKLVKEMRK